MSSPSSFWLDSCTGGIEIDRFSGFRDLEPVRGLASADRTSLIVGMSKVFGQIVLIAVLGATAVKGVSLTLSCFGSYRADVSSVGSVENASAFCDGI